MSQIRLCVLGSGGGALAVAADFASKGHHVMLGDLPQFEHNLVPIRERGGIEVVSEWAGSQVYPVQVADSLAKAIQASELILIVVPCFGHSTFADLLLPTLHPGVSVVFIGEGSGSLVADKILRKQGKLDVRIGETNTLPYMARGTRPGAVEVRRKSGGVFLSTIPAAETNVLIKLLKSVWSCLLPAESVWETILLNYNVIDHVPPIVCNAGAIENRQEKMLLWGEGASPSVVKVIEAIDFEILQIRNSLGLPNRGRYRDLLIAQGFAQDVSNDLNEVIEDSVISQVSITPGLHALRSRFLTEDVPYGMVLIASLADELAIETPVIDSLIVLASVLTGNDFSIEGRHLAEFNLRGVGHKGLLAFATSGELPE